MQQLSTEAIRMLESQVGKPTVQSWFNSLLIQNGDAGCTIIFPSQFVQSWVRRNYGDLFDTIIRSVYGVQTIKFEVQANIAAQDNVISEYSMQINYKMNFSNFVVGDANRAAYMAADRVGKDTFPLFIHAAPGHGKSHLLHSICNRFISQGKKVCYLSAEQYMLLFVKSIKDKETIKFKNSMRAVDILLVDDFQFMQGKESTQEEFLYNLSSLISEQKCVVIAADRAPSELQVDQRIRARVAGGLVMHMETPSEELKLRILEQKAREYRKNIGREILEMITGKIKGSVRELEGALLRICAQIEFFGEKITLENSRVILTDMTQSRKQKVLTPEHIINVVQTYYNCVVGQKDRKSVRARQICMYFCRKLRNLSLPMIAKLFDAKDHTNVLYSIKQVETKMQSDPNFGKEIQLLRSKVESNE